MINVFSSSFAKQDNVGELNKTKPEKGNTEFDLLPLVNTTQTRVRGPGAYLGKMISGARPVLISILNVSSSYGNIQFEITRKLTLTETLQIASNLALRGL